MTRADMDRVRDEFVAATRMAEEAGFDMVELHAAHGYLLSGFLTPLQNKRDDEYGGSLDNRLRFPLEVFAAMRAAWPSHKPMSVRISANDWAGEDGRHARRSGADRRGLRARGRRPDRRLGRARPGPRRKPVYGRMFQTPFSDQIRNEGRLATMAVGNIYEPDHANSILAAGRADLVALARPHLIDPMLDAARRGGARLPRHPRAAAISQRPGPACPQPQARGGDGRGGAKSVISGG